MVAPQYEPLEKESRKLLASAFVFEHRSQLTRCYKQLDFIVAVSVILLEYPFQKKVGSDLGEENSITSIRWTTQFVRVRRISDLVEDLYGNASQINRSQNSV